MRTWETNLVVIKEVDFDYDLHEFEVYDKKGKRLGTITPSDVENMGVIAHDLDNGECPIADNWEDGEGNTCNLKGW